MERATRSQSLVDLHSGAAGPSRSSGTTTSHLSLLDLSGTSRHGEESLLDTGSPASSPNRIVECDPSVLDIDSDSPEGEKQDERDDNMLVDSATNDQLITSIDPLYRQCKNARRMSFVDRLVSVTNDGTFGSVVSSPSPQIGHLTDYEGIANTFCGSRIQNL
jgi:hypothetical protein